ncbi:MAG: NUDIX domain-containing protein [Clostridia bacterium]|nr:NUDIX domain-containing protein [Clostridia bacterium]
MKFCYECGTKLEAKELEGEGMIPYCQCCGKYVFPIYSTAVSMIVQSPDRKKILLIQQYGTGNNVLVAGYINKGENAESAVRREVMEEIGIETDEICFNKSEYFPKTNTLMLNFSCIALSEDLSHLSEKEIDRAAWFDIAAARDSIMPDSLAKRFLFAFLDGKQFDGNVITRNDKK